MFIKLQTRTTFEACIKLLNTYNGPYNWNYSTVRVFLRPRSKIQFLSYRKVNSWKIVDSNYLVIHTIFGTMKTTLINQNFTSFPNKFSPKLIKVHKHQIQF
eukprot:EC096513.1.p3 GENE.EC096513.1~~EC096513.1.p3  ORF type:complete len:101 (-),score=1.70 EC096513.1:60-362(-)